VEPLSYVKHEWKPKCDVVEAIIGELDEKRRAEEVSK